MYIQLGDSYVPVTPEVAAFAACMETKLRMDGKGVTPKDFSFEQLLKHLEHKVRTLKTTPPEDAFTKAVIIGIYAMMLADKASEEKGKTGLKTLVQAAPENAPVHVAM